MTAVLNRGVWWAQLTAHWGPRENYVHTALCPFPPFSAFQGSFMTFDGFVNLFLEGTKPSVVTFREASWVECFPSQWGVGKSLKIANEREKRKRGVMGEGVQGHLWGLTMSYFLTWVALALYVHSVITHQAEYLWLVPFSIQYYISVICIFKIYIFLGFSRKSQLSQTWCPGPHHIQQKFYMLSLCFLFPNSWILVN